MSSSPTKRRRSDALVGIMVLALSAAVVAWLAFTKAGSSLFPPPAATTQGKEIRGLYDIVFAFAAVIFFLVEGLIVWTVIRYRRQPGDDELPEQTHGNNIAEITWTVVPTLIVAFLFVVSWGTLNSVNAVAPNPAVHVRAVAAQFQWQFDYLDQDGKTKLFTQSVATADGGGGLVVPVGQNIELQLSSADVIHAFYVPRFLFKRDVVPGLNNRFDFTVDPSEAGQTIRGQCAELCGIGHRVMLFDVLPMTSTNYAAWLQQQIVKAKATPAPAPSGPPGGGPAAQLKLVAKNIAFDLKDLTATAGQPFQIVLDNEDSGVPHDVWIKDAGGNIVFKDDTVNGVTTKTYDAPALKAGTYSFYCSVHPIPAMTGTLTVK
ncbi:MAG TPA: cytochrome c oxidase subunit II [Candidatus Limnocylindrales bacterium]|jgi:cytochrome c oxidase subunit 2